MDTCCCSAPMFYSLSWMTKSRAVFSSFSFSFERMKLHHVNSIPILQKKNQIAIGQPARLCTCSNDAPQRRKYGYLYEVLHVFFLFPHDHGHPAEEPGSTFYRHNARVLRSPWNN